MKDNVLGREREEGAEVVSVKEERETEGEREREGKKLGLRLHCKQVRRTF